MDSGDELIILRVVTVDMTGKCRGSYSWLRRITADICCLVDKRTNVQALLHHEENKARENANAVLNKVLDKESDIEVRPRIYVTYPPLLRYFAHNRYPVYRSV
jgi:hypothetical protein